MQVHDRVCKYKVRKQPPVLETHGSGGPGLRVNMLRNFLTILIEFSAVF
jgi:hypothetical protein